MARKRLIMMDTGSEPTEEIIGKYDIELMGMKLFLDDKTYIDGADMDKETYYSIIDKVKDFNTNPPLVWEIRKIYEEIKRRGYNEIIGVHVSSKMSNLITTCNNARGMVSGLDVRILDTENISAGAYLVAEKVIELLHAGKPYETVVSLLPEIRSSTLMQVSLSSLKYLVKNKRIGRAQALVGNLLGLRPILSIDEEGYLTPLSKERGKEKMIQKISENALRFLEKRPYNVKIYLIHGLDKNKRQVEAVYTRFMEGFEKLGIENYRVIRNRIWPTVANLSGPEAYAFAVYGEERPLE